MDIRIMYIRSYIKELRKSRKRCFTLKNIVEQFHISRGHARVSLHRLLKSGDLISPVRGLYVMVPPEHQPHGSIPAEEIVPLITRHMGARYYVSLLTAGLFYGATHQKPARFQVISDKRVKRLLVFGDIEIEFIYKKSVLNLPTQYFTVSTGYLIVATPELIALDLLTYPEHAGGLNHIATLLSELIERLDAALLINLAKQTKTEYQLQRIGYILDNVELMDEAMAETFIEKLASHVKAYKKKYLPLASEMPKTGFPRCKKWRIVMNTDIESD